MTQPIQWTVYLWGVVAPASVFALLAQSERARIDFPALERTLFNIAGLYFVYAGFIAPSRHLSFNGYFVISLFSWYAFIYTIPSCRIGGSDELSDIEREIALFAPLIIIPLILVLGK